MKKARTTIKEKLEKKVPEQQESYLTKRVLIRAANRGLREAAEETMSVMGYVIIAKKIAGDKWIVKKYADGHIEKIKKLDTENAWLNK